MTEVRLLQRLSTSPYSRPYLWRSDAVLVLHAGVDAWSIRFQQGYPAVSVVEDTSMEADATLRCDAEDLLSMLDGQAPAGQVGYALGTRPGPPWRAQAWALLALAALGWAGPWPDPTADAAHIPLLRRAVLDLTLGPPDARARLFPQDQPVAATVRIREGAEGLLLCTEGLSDQVGAWELSTVVPPRGPLPPALGRLRAVAAFQAEAGGLPPRLEPLTLVPEPALPAGLPLPHQRCGVMRVG